MALPFSLIPCMGLLSLPLSGLGLLLGFVGGIVALSRNGRGIGFPIAGSALCAMSLVFGVLWLGVLTAARNAVGEASSPSDGDTWADASKSFLTSDELRVRIKSARVGRVPLTSLGIGGQSKKNALMVFVEMANESATKKVDYETWGGINPLINEHIPRLTDNFGNQYKTISFDLVTEVKDKLKRESIHPGKKIVDVIVFEPPLENAKYLDLALPTSAFGGKGKPLRFRIPAAMIEWN
jgi:hypothetical protein